MQITYTQDNMFLFLTDEEETSVLLNKLKNKKSPGSNGIGNKILKECMQIISPFLSKIVT